MQIIRISAAIAAILVSGLAACATAVNAPPAVVDYVRKDCPAAANLSEAIILTPDNEKAVFAVSTPVGVQTPCIHRHGRSSPYVAYALPADFEDKTLTVGAALEPARILSPDVSILDRQGKVTRSFSSADYFFRGLGYSVQFRPREGEAYVLVAVDPARVGRRYDSIAIGTNTTAVYAAGVVTSFTTGADDSYSRTFSYDGVVQVSVYDSDTAEKQ